MNKPLIAMIPSSETRDVAAPTPSEGCISGLRDAGAEALLIDYRMPKHDLKALLGRVDGLLLQGGGDVDPERYGEARHAKCGPAFPERDALELFALQIALERNIPVLTICRGTQVLNVCLGGTLYQDLPDQLGLDHNLGAALFERHIVQLSPGSLVQRIAGVGSMPTNSTHHQSIKALGSGLAISARHMDGVVEAIELPSSRFVLGLQWHPERTLQLDAPSMKFFEAFVQST